jgi:hypothetical protein
MNGDVVVYVALRLQAVLELPNAKVVLRHIIPDEVGHFAYFNASVVFSSFAETQMIFTLTRVGEESGDLKTEVGAASVVFVERVAIVLTFWRYTARAIAFVGPEAAVHSTIITVHISITISHSIIWRIYPTLFSFHILSKSCCIHKSALNKVDEAQDIAQGVI